MTDFALVLVLMELVVLLVPVERQVHQGLVVPQLLQVPLVLAVLVELLEHLDPLLQVEPLEQVVLQGQVLHQEAQEVLLQVEHQEAQVPQEHQLPVEHLVLLEVQELLDLLVVVVQQDPLGAQVLQVPAVHLLQQEQVEPQDYKETYIEQVLQTVLH